MRKCSVDGCGRPHYAVGLCSAHYQRQARYGGINSGKPIRRMARGVSAVRPTYMSQETFLAILDDVRAHVAAGDSFEGFVQYLMPEEDDPAGGFRVEARYRVGNLAGQGGMRIIAEEELP